MLLLPEPLAGLAHQLTGNRPVGMAGNLDHAPVWLSPGRRPRHPNAPTHLARRLGRLGVDYLASRNTVLLQLAAEVPAAVVADLLGLNPSTATKWAQLAGGDVAGWPPTATSSGPSNPTQSTPLPAAIGEPPRLAAAQKMAAPC